MQMDFLEAKATRGKEKKKKKKETGHLISHTSGDVILLLIFHR